MINIAGAVADAANMVRTWTGKVLIVAPAFWPSTAYGGPTDSISQLAKGLFHSGCEVRVVTTDADGAKRLRKEFDSSNFDGVEIEYARRVARHDIAPALATAVWRAAPWADLIHLNGIFCFSSLPGLLAGRRFQKPVIWSARGALEGDNVGARKSLAKRGLFKLATAVEPSVTVHFTSQEEAHRSRAMTLGIRSVVVPNGVDLPDTLPPWVNASTVELLFLGRLHPIKALDRLIQALALARRAGVNVRLTVAGESVPGYQRELLELAAGLGVDKLIRWVGFVDAGRKWELFSNCSLLVLPSHSENFGRVVPEALAHGRPVIASTGTPWQEVENQLCGIWANNEPESLAEAIRRASGSDLRRMGEAGRKWVESRFSWTAVSKLMANAYDASLGAWRRV